MWRDRLIYNPLKTIACIIALCFAAALILAGLVGAIWAVTEAVNQVMTWVL